MSAKGIDEAIERIATEPEFAGSVLADPAGALESYDLTDDERTSIGDALAADVEAAGYEVQGFSFALGSIDWGSVQLHNTAALGQFQGTFDRSQNAIVLLEL
ncbi:MAG TPA: hypothetical protein VEI83_03195 [Acidimicrobiales bacterium]|nr:hypothetical protein [Acidimicrobiales bacterium]